MIHKKSNYQYPNLKNPKTRIEMFAKLKNGKVDQYPYTLTELISDNPSTSFPFDPLSDSELRKAFNVVEVQENPKPDFNAQTHFCIEKTPELKSGQWIQLWQTKAKTSAEKNKGDSDKWAEVRNERNQKIQETDWHMIKVLETGENASALKNYRQKLRDIPQDHTDPFFITWPEKP